MTDNQAYTLQEAQQHFAKSLNGKVWEYLQKPDRTSAEDELMVHAAHASCYHWMNLSAGLPQQRGEWLIAHVYCELGLADAALRHASRCLELTREYADQMKDFDRAYGFEAVARANALARNRDEAAKYRRLAEEAGQAIADAEDKSIFLGDLNGGNWHGLI